MVKLLRDTTIVFSREFTPQLRQPLGLIFAMIQPLLFMFLFGGLLAGASGYGAASGSSWQWFVPGILITMSLFGPMAAGHSLLVELIGGATERMMVTPLSRTAMVIGRTMKESVILLTQAMVIVALALPLGFRLHPAGALAGLALLVVFGIGLSGMSFALAIAAQPNGTLFWMVTQVLMYPLLLLSGVLLPIEDGPGWVQAIAKVNPIAYLVDAERVLFAGELADLSALYGLIAACAVAVLGLFLGTRAMRRGV
ncbi:ABC transporter permease [Amycolatopsis taiwanensis]|uniref:ABC transporter permease n=1 Tax=Amycolatopsis taiwanensis TaxID=342230 RepID=UPI0004856473|nr:ABC transporter permease [Amycolatopsis taiwanensis]